MSWHMSTGAGSSIYNKKSVSGTDWAGYKALRIKLAEKDICFSKTKQQSSTAGNYNCTTLTLMRSESVHSSTEQRTLTCKTF